MEGRILAELHNVGQEYGAGRRRFVALSEVSFSLREGDFVALLGPSGCGKSTLLRILTGLQRPTSGKCVYQGRELVGVNPDAAIVFQTFAVFPWLTVHENVQAALTARNIPEKLAAAKAVDLLDRVGLDGFENAYPRELSAGMRQKVGFARAMAVEPELLCLDEPFSSLDVLSAESLRNELLELWSGGKIPTKAVLLVTHNIDEAVLMADRILVMDKDPGRVVKEIRVAAPHPRRRKSAAYVGVVDHVFAVLAGQTQSEAVELGAAPGETGKTRPLPYVEVNELAGLLEHLNEYPGRGTDVYRLSQDLKMESDALLPIIEAVELMGFAVVGQGDIHLTPLGETFSEASILTRKEMFAARAKRLPVFGWLLGVLRAAEHKRLALGLVEKALGLEFPAEEASRQVETVVDWGRYAELLAYDDDSETLFLESGAGG